MPDPRYPGVPSTSPISSTPHMAALGKGGKRFNCGTPLLLTGRDGTSMPDPWPPQGPELRRLCIGRASLPAQDVGTSVNASLPES